MKQPLQQTQQKRKIVEGREPYKKYTDNSVLNDVLNETAQSDEWKTINTDSNKVNETISSQYSDLMNGNQNGEDIITSMGVSPDNVDDSVKDALNRDYSKLVKKMNQQPRGKITKWV